MAFLSLEQRRAGSAQLASYARLIEEDIERLRQAERDLQELRRTVLLSIDKTDRSVDGELSADELEAVDGQTRERLMYGIAHYPVRVENGPKRVVGGRWP